MTNKELDELITVCSLLNDYAIIAYDKLSEDNVEFLFNKNVNVLHNNIASQCKLTKKQFVFYIENKIYDLAYNRSLTKSQFNILFNLLLKNNNIGLLGHLNTAYLTENHKNILLDINDEHCNNNLSFSKSLSKNHILTLFNLNDNEITANLLANEFISNKIKKELIQKIIKKEVFK